MEGGVVTCRQCRDSALARTHSRHAADWLNTRLTAQRGDGRATDVRGGGLGDAAHRPPLPRTVKAARCPHTIDETCGKLTPASLNRQSIYDTRNLVMCFLNKLTIPLSHPVLRN